VESDIIACDFTDYMTRTIFIENVMLSIIGRAEKCR